MDTQHNAKAVPKLIDRSIKKYEASPKAYATRHWQGRQNHSDYDRKRRADGCLSISVALPDKRFVTPLRRVLNDAVTDQRSDEIAQRCTAFFRCR
jgi:hypothetical protein